MTYRIALWEPEPRISGPSTWADNVRHGLRVNGHYADVVAATKSGRPRVAWGRTVRESSASASCTLVPDLVVPDLDLPDVLGEYDLVILSDVRCAPQDKIAWREFDAWPPYVDVLRESKAPFCSVAHFKLYYEPHEAPKGCAAYRGSPFIRELLKLPNFTGFLMTHHESHLENCEALREIPRKGLHPLPYRMRYGLGPKAETPTLCTLGRIDFLKYRHLVHEVMGLDPAFDECNYLTGGGCPVARGPSDLRQYYEELVDELGFDVVDEWVGGVKRAVPFSVRKGRQFVRYLGTYDTPEEVAGSAHVHVGISAEYMSGGILEYAALEAIDLGCIPVVTPGYDPGYLDYIGVTRHRSFPAFSSRRQKLTAEHLADVRDAIRDAYAMRGEAAKNRAVVSVKNDPAEYARILIEGALG